MTMTPKVLVATRDKGIICVEHDEVPELVRKGAIVIARDIDVYQVAVRKKSENEDEEDGA